MQEIIQDYAILCETKHFNEWGNLKLSSYQSLFSSIAEQHLSTHQLHIQSTLKSGFAWVLIGLTVDIITPILEPMFLMANTWHSAREGIYFRREFKFKDDQGRIRFQGATFSVLIDIEKRTIYKESHLPFTIPFEPTPIFQVATTPRMTSIIGLQSMEKVTIPPSFMDRLGHVNNVRYGDLAYDALTLKEQQTLKQLKRMQIAFASELNRGDQVQLQKGYFESDIYIRGVHEQKMKASFDMKLTGL